MTTTTSAKTYSVRPSRTFYFSDGDTIITCRDRSYRVHSALLSSYSCVMRKALSVGRLPRLWKTLQDSPRGKIGKSGGGVAERRRGASARARDIQYFISLDESIQTINLLLYCIYSCSSKPRITHENITHLFHLSTTYSIPTLLPHCITFLDSLTLFHPLRAITTLRNLLHHRRTTPSSAALLQPLYSEALCTILNDLPRYTSEHNDEYTRILPSELREAFSDCWARYVDRMTRFRSPSALFGGFVYPHSRHCRDSATCEAETRSHLESDWKELWEECTRGVPRPCEVSRFFMTAERAAWGMCRVQIRIMLGRMLRSFGGEDAVWNWGFLSVEDNSLRMAKEMAIRSRGGGRGVIYAPRET